MPPASEPRITEIWRSWNKAGGHTAPHRQFSSPSFCSLSYLFPKALLSCGSCFNRSILMCFVFSCPSFSTHLIHLGSYLSAHLCLYWEPLDVCSRHLRSMYDKPEKLDVWLQATKFLMFVYIQNFFPCPTRLLSGDHCPPVHLSKTQLLFKQQELLVFLVIMYQPSVCQPYWSQLAASELWAADPDFTATLLNDNIGCGMGEIT